MGKKETKGATKAKAGQTQTVVKVVPDLDNFEGLLRRELATILRRTADDLDPVKDEPSEPDQPESVSAPVSGRGCGEDSSCCSPGGCGNRAGGPNDPAGSRTFIPTFKLSKADLLRPFDYGPVPRPPEVLESDTPTERLSCEPPEWWKSDEPVTWSIFPTEKNDPPTRTAPSNEW